MCIRDREYGECVQANSMIDEIELTAPLRPVIRVATEAVSYTHLKLYEREKVNPMGGCLWSLIPMIVLIALYGIIREPITYFMNLSMDQIKEAVSYTHLASMRMPSMAGIELLAATAREATVTAEDSRAFSQENFIWIPPISFSLPEGERTGYIS